MGRNVDDFDIVAAQHFLVVIRHEGFGIKIVAALLGLLTLLEYLLGWDLKIDQLLIDDHTQAYNVFRGRMSPMSAAAFIAAGAALAAMPYARFKVVSKLGASAVKDSLRLFMVPGMGHCNGGDATDTFDMLAAMEQWVEKGKAPDRIEASRMRDGKTDRTRPLCPYPQVATYTGSGSIDEAANFVCKAR